MDRRMLLGLHLRDHFRMWFSIGLSTIFRRVKHVFEVLAVGLAAISAGATLAHGCMIALLHFDSAGDAMRVAR